MLPDLYYQCYQAIYHVFTYTLMTIVFAMVPVLYHVQVDLATKNNFRTEAIVPY